MTLFKSTLAAVISCMSSADIWSLIQENYSHKLVSNHAYYKTKLTNLKCGSFQSTSQRPSHFLMLSLPSVTQTVLCGLGTEYDMLVTSTEMQPEVPKFSVIQDQLLRFKARANTSSQKSESSASATLMAS